MTPSAAMAALLGAWALPMSGNQEQSCRKVLQRGYKCQPLHGAWQQLININLPAQLEFMLSDGELRYATLLKARGDEWVLAAGTVSAPFRQDALLPLWTGRAVVLWQPGPGRLSVVRPGNREPAVLWIRQQLHLPADSDEASMYDAELVARVVEFQKARGLKADGVVGLQTLMALQAAAPASGIPQLNPAVH